MFLIDNTSRENGNPSPGKSSLDFYAQRDLSKSRKRVAPIIRQILKGSEYKIESQSSETIITLGNHRQVYESHTDTDWCNEDFKHAILIAA